VIGTFFSVDVETSATVHTAGYLLTVGIVPVVHVDGAWQVHPRSFYVRLDHGDPSRFPEPEHYTSMPWWREQDDAVQDEAYRDRNLVRHYSSTAARMILEYVTEIQPEWSMRFFAANPVSFDKPWIDELFADQGLPAPFHYRSLCLRSMKFGMDPSKGFGNDRETHESTVPHHALYDALAQAHDLIDMLGSQS
jgi:hypothetical protein